MQGLPPFISENGEPSMSTTEYWTRFTFVLLMGSKNIQIDELLAKTEELDNTEKLHMKIAKATFITLIGKKTVEILQNRNPKDKVLEKDLKWIKANWEEIWNETANQNHMLVKLLKVKRERRESVLDFWNKLTKMTAECKLDDKSSAEIISALIVAVFTVSVEDEEIVKAVWEKSMKPQELSDHIAKQAK